MFVKAKFADILDSMCPNSAASTHSVFCTHCSHICMQVNNCTTLQVSGLAARLKQADKDAALYNSREALFGKPTTDYSQVKKLWETFEPFQQFWSVAAAWQVTQSLAASAVCHKTAQHTANCASIQKRVYCDASTAMQVLRCKYYNASADVLCRSIKELGCMTPCISWTERL